MKKSPFLFLLLFSANVSFGQANHPKARVELIAICDKFMESFEKGKFDDAYNLIKAYTILENYRLDTLAITSGDQMANLSASFGKPLSYDRLPEKLYKLTLCKITYLLKFERSFMVFRFLLYNNGDYWTIDKLNYDEESDALFMP